MTAEPFSAFMQRALYDPQRGYYTARIRTVGARGDFSTSATLSAKLGKAIAAWLMQESKATNVKTIIEVGGGDGSLMQSVLAALGWWQRRRFRVLMVEASPVLMAQQHGKLSKQVQAWFGTLPEALAECAGEALIFSNELLDAFPVDVVQWDGSAWQEVWVDAGREVQVPWERGVLRSHPLTPSPLPKVEGEHLGNVPSSLAKPSLSSSHDQRQFIGAGSHEEVQINPPLPSGEGRGEGPLRNVAQLFSALRSPPAKPQRYELATALHSWLHGWLPHWQRGAMLAIDYGDVFPALYHRRPRGTLRAYLLQQRLEGADVYANPGRQDITCDVNFTDWRAWLAEAGLSEVFFENQAAFLQRGGRARSQADHFIEEAGGAGTAFQCHAVRRG